MKENILLVDDNIDFLDSVKDVLEQEGYKVATAGSGEAALSMIEFEPFAMILMDIKMPGINGVECFLRMRSRRPDVRVILLTAYALNDLIQTAHENGVLAVMKKPLEMNKLLHAIAAFQPLTDSSRRVLIVDDDQALCDNLAEILRSEGYRVDIATDGAEAVKASLTHAVDILLVDMKLPKLNGLEVYRLIKSAQPDVGTVVMTGYAKELANLVDQALQENAIALITKPLDMAALLKLLKAIVVERTDKKPGLETF
jgi:two-component system, NtrC family, response regulator HydG